MRVSQRQIYNNSISYMNQNLSDLMESNMQASSEKRVNRPSDDPVGMSRILSYRSSITAMEFNQNNIKMASGWLAQADAALADTGAGVSSVLTKIKTLAEQAATGTVSEENRKQIATQLRELFGTLINLANTQFDGSHIFAGHKTEKPAYVMGLNVSCSDPGLDPAGSVGPPPTLPFPNASGFLKDALYDVHGATQYTSLIQFTGATGEISGQTFRYSIDGGTTWHDDGTISGDGTDVIDPSAIPPKLGPIVLNLPTAGQQITMRSSNPNATSFNPVAQQVDTENKNQTGNGTWMYVRPTAIYQGDTNDNPPVVKSYPTTATPAGGSGYFTRDVAVRINSIGSSPTDPINYSYSLDDGNTWVQSTAPFNSTRLPVPGGFLDLSAPLAATDLNTQYIIHPQRADIELEVGPDEFIRINNVGKDIFGGLYSTSNTNGYIPAIRDKLAESSRQYGVGEGEANNMFEVVGRLIGYCDTNSQQGIQQALADLSVCHSTVLTAAADVGGRENRLSTIDYITSSRIDADTEGLSRIEDIDVTVLMTKLAQQQLAYNAVLKSSSMIMQMSLMNFI